MVYIPNLCFLDGLKVNRLTMRVKNAVQIVNDVRSIWSALDPDMSVTKNLLDDPELLEDMVHLGILKTQHMKATAIQSKL